MDVISRSLTLREEHGLGVLRRIFGPKREEVAGAWRRLHNEEHRNLYASSNIRKIESRRMRRAGHAECMGKMRIAYKNLIRKPEGRDYSVDRGVEGRIILEWTLEK
jgi:hypothetical protein